MDNEMNQAKWDEIKGKIKSKWGIFNDSEIESFKDNLEQIVWRVQMAYGRNKDVALREYDEFKLSLEPVTRPDKIVIQPKKV